MVNDTRLDSDYLHRNPRTDPGSELSLPIRVGGRVWGVLNLEQAGTRTPSPIDDLLLGHIVAGQVGAAIYRCQLVDELEGAFLTTLGVIADAVELQDAYTADHANEVADLAVAGRRAAWASTGSSWTGSATAPCCTTSARSASPASCCASPAR